MRIHLRFLLFLCALMPLLHAGTWAPIPAEVWAMKEDADKGIKGAVILERRMIFRTVQIEYLVRIRILGESGRKAAELAEFGDDAHSFEGRTVYPDGKVVPFNNRKDFTEGTAVSVGNTDIKRTVMIPPGVTSNCLVEVRWKESSNQRGRSPLPKRMGSSWEWVLGDAYPTELNVVEIPGSFPWAYSLVPGPVHQPEVKEQGGFKIFAFRNLPAFEESPYSLQATRPAPRLAIFNQPDLLLSHVRGTPQAYWDAASRIFVRNWFDGEIQIGKVFKAFAQELTSGLSGSAQTRARELLLRLDTRIKNRGHLTFEENRALEKRDAYPEDEDLDALVKDGAASASGMRVLYFQLLKAAGIQPKIALVADRDIRLAKASSMNLFQFTHELIGVEEAGQKTIWLDPTKRFAPAGMIHPDFQGTQAMVVDSATWTCVFMNLPPQAPEFNSRSYRYEVDMEEGEDRFTVDAQFGGYPEYAERYRFLSLESKEQERLLREELEGYLKQAAFTRVQVLNAQSPAQPFGWRAEGKIEREDGRRREVYPFPAMRTPMNQPDAWPDTRKDMIVIPYLRTQRAVSRIRVPKGYQIPKIDPIQEKNIFGTVSWSLKPLDRPDELEVTLEVVASGFAAQPSGYSELKQFMNWVATAANRTLILGRER